MQMANIMPGRRRRAATQNIQCAAGQQTIDEMYNLLVVRKAARQLSLVFGTSSNLPRENLAQRQQMRCTTSSSYWCTSPVDASLKSRFFAPQKSGNAYLANPLQSFGPPRRGGLSGRGLHANEWLVHPWILCEGGCPSGAVM